MSLLGLFVGFMHVHTYFYCFRLLVPIHVHVHGLLEQILWKYTFYYIIEIFIKRLSIYVNCEKGLNKLFITHQFSYCAKNKKYPDLLLFRISCFKSLLLWINFTRVQCFFSFSNTMFMRTGINKKLVSWIWCSFICRVSFVGVDFSGTNRKFIVF